jgi:hypothetical protein
VSLTPVNSFLAVSLTPAKNVRLFGYFPVTRIKFFAGVVDTAEQFIAGVKTLAINIHSRISPRIFEKIQNGPIGILGGLGDTDS